MKRIIGKNKNGKKFLITVAGYDIPRDPDLSGGGRGYNVGSVKMGASANQYMYISGSSNWMPGTDSFTIEWFQKHVYQTSFSRLFTIKTWPNAEIGVSIESATTGTTDSNASLYLWLDGLGNIPAVANAAIINTPRLRQWDHFAITRKSGSYLQIFRNGVALRTITTPSYVTSNLNVNTSPMFIGSEGDGVVNTRFSGSITNFRFTKGYALYSSSYSVPSLPLEPVAGTTLLLKTDDNLSPFKDSSTTNTNVYGQSCIWTEDSPFS